MKIKKIPKYFCIILIKIYQTCLSPFFVNRCNFRPTCSEYMLEAIKIHGVFKGILLGTKRLIKCTPNREFTFDPVPSKTDKTQ